MKGSIIKYSLISVAAVFLLLVIWQIAASIINLPLILPSPPMAVGQITILVRSIDFWHHLWATLSRGLFGFGISLVVGVILGFMAGKYTWIEAFLRPLIIFVRSTPSMSLILLALIWFKGDTVPVFVNFLMVFPMIIQNIIEGIKNIDRELLEMVNIYRVKQWRQLTTLYFPSLLPYLAAGIAAGLGVTWKVLIAAEVLAYPAWGIGTQMDTARVYLQTDKVFAWTIVVMVIGIFFDYLLDYLLRRPFSAWKGTDHA